MATWLEPLKLQTFFMNIFAGNPDYFIAIALILIAAMAEYFRVTTLTLFFMIGLFLFMFFEYTMSPILTLFLIISGLLIGYVISRQFASR